MGKMLLATGLALTTWTGVAMAAAPPQPPIVMGEAVEYPHAGIAMATPADFQPQPLTSAFDIVKVQMLEDGKPAQAVTLSAFPVGPKTTPDDFAEAKVAELRKNLAIRQFTVVKKVPMPVANLPGTALRMSYTFRGIETVGIQAYFLRELKNADTRICYLLTVVCSAKRESRLIPILGSVVRSVRLIAVHHSVIPDSPVLGDPLEDYEKGFCIRPLRGWYIGKSMLGAEMGQIDYLLGGVPMFWAQLVATDATADAMNSEACAKQYLGLTQATAAQRQQSCEVISQGPSRLGRAAAYDFVLRQSAGKEPALTRPAGEKSPATVIVQRTACIPRGPLELPKVYVLIVTVQGDQVKPAKDLMEALSGGFAPLGQGPPAATQPAVVAPGPETTPARPPASAPATAPPPTRPGFGQPSRPAATAPATASSPAGAPR